MMMRITPLAQLFQQGATTAEISVTPGNPAYVLLRDVQNVFPAASRFRCDNRMLEFMTDGDESRIFPLRILIQPGSIIHVVPEPDGTVTRPPRNRDRIRANSPMINQSHITFSAPSSPSPSPSSPSSSPASSPTAYTSIAELANTTRAPLARSISSEKVPSQTYHKSVSLYESYMQTIQFGQTEYTQNLFDNFQLQYDIFLQDPSIHIHPELCQTMHQMRERMAAPFQQTTGRLSPELSRTPSLSVPLYELQECVTSRLFIVLPHQNLFLPPPRSTISIPPTFRLHLLCECRANINSNSQNEPGPNALASSCTGERQSSQYSIHSACSGSRVSVSENSLRAARQAHLTSHGGYEIERPTEFFQQYGTYLLNVLEAFKKDITSDGFLEPCPELEVATINSTPASPIVSIPTALASYDVEHGVNQAIEFLRSIPHNSADKQRVVDMKHVATFLRNSASDKVLGNLFKVQTQGGVVDWVCRDHFYEMHPHGMVVRPLHDVSALNHGTFDEQLGRLEITLPTQPVATKVYKVIERAKGLVQELKLTLKWEVPIADVLMLRDTLNRANVRHLTLWYEPSAAKVDFMNRNKRSGPLWDMISGHKLHSLSLEGYTGLFSKVSRDVQPHELQSLKISECVDWKKDGARVLEFIRKGSKLAELRLGCTDIEEAYTAILKVFRSQNTSAGSGATLRLLALTTSVADNVTVRFSRDGPIMMALCASTLANTILQRATCLRTLHIRSKMNTALGGYRGRFESIISENQDLIKLSIQCQPVEFVELFQTVRSIALGTRNQVKILNLYRDRNQLSTTNIRNDGDTCLELLSLNEPKEALDALFEQYGSRLTKLRITGVKKKAPKLYFELLESATRFSGSRLSELVIDISAVETEGLVDLQRVIVRSAGLTKLRVDITMAFDPLTGGPEWVQFIVGIGRKLTEVQLVQAHAASWQEELRGYRIPEIENAKLVTPAPECQLQVMDHMKLMRLG
ncbi:hypothetical protein BGZ74_009175 [Mortierella antarctica]|nr:hypothetical protein BGZ74_009175 [Mortierella antarctica]